MAKRLREQDHIIKRLQRLEEIPDFEVDQQEMKCLKKLINFEKNIDAVLSKKRLDIQEMLAVPSIKLKAVLRLHLYSVFYEKDSKNLFEIRLVGKILTNKKHENSFHQPKKMSNFVKVIQFIQVTGGEIQPSAHWQKQGPTRKNDRDGFVFRGVCTEGENNVRVKLMLDTPHIYKLKPELAKLVGKTTATRQGIISALWEYVKANKLQDKEKKNMINCDSGLRDIFKQDTILIDMLSIGIKDFISALDPIQINYKFNRDSKIEENEKIYDLKIDIDPPFTEDTMPFFVQKLILDKKEKKKMISGGIKAHPHILANEKVKKLESTIISTIEKIHDHTIKNRNYEEFSKNPSLFIENLILQQNKLLKMMKKHDLRKTNNAQLDERSAMNKLLTEYQDLAYDEIRKYTSKLTEHDRE